MKPFDRVLVHVTPDWEWMPNIFSKEVDGVFFTIDGRCWPECIPYEGNEHLLGTSDSPTPPEPDFKFGDKVEVSNDRAYWYKAIYLQKGTNEHHFPCVVVVHENNSTHANWTYCRKADW